MREMIRRPKTAKSCDGKSSVSKLAARPPGAGTKGTFHGSGVHVTVPLINDKVKQIVLGLKRHCWARRHFCSVYLSIAG